MHVWVASIDLGFSADPVSAIYELRLIPYPLCILKIYSHNSLDYRAAIDPCLLKHIAIRTNEA